MIRLVHLATAFVMYALFTSSEVVAQNLSVGVIAGGGLTDGFYTTTLPDGMHLLSTSKDYLVGPTIQWRVSPSWLFEADALFRELHFGRTGTQSDGTQGSVSPAPVSPAPVSPAPVVTWEFPLLAKYRLALGRARPVLEAGPSFRTAGNLNGTNPSHYGFTAGVGVEMRVKALTFAPVVRYTRWAADSVGSIGGVSYGPKSKPSQLELAVGVSASPETNAHPLSSRVSIGLLVGVGLTNSIHTTGYGLTYGTQSYSWITSPRRGELFGGSIEARLPAAFSIEADAVYVPLRSTLAMSVNGVSSKNLNISIGNWNMPILAKRHFQTRCANIFLEAGPAFRVGTGQVSHYGLTAGFGLEARAKRIRIAPTLRYSRWAAKLYDQGMIRDQLDLYAAFVF